MIWAYRLVGAPIKTALLWSLLICQIILKRPTAHQRNPLLSSTARPSSRRHHEQESSLQRTLNSNRMERCVALLGIRSMRKHAAPSVTIPCAFSTQQGCPIVVGVNCETTVWAMETRLRDRAA
jgi:hypothetical protein